MFEKAPQADVFTVKQHGKRWRVLCNGKPYTLPGTKTFADGGGYTDQYDAVQHLRDINKRMRA